MDPKAPLVSPRMDAKATIKRNSDTWDTDTFNLARKQTAGPEFWARLVATHPGYPNVDIVKDDIVFGRREDADVCVRDGAVSNTHCRIWRESPRPDDDEHEHTGKSIGTIWLEDLSTNGTFIKDQKIGKGNKIQIPSGTEIILIPRGVNRVKVSYIIYVPSHEEQEEAPEGRVTFVFTDVQNSTLLWERCPNGMNEALKKHDNILRRLLRKYRGYEVKTEGDAFMVSFFTALDAILWCLAVQKALLAADWPEELLQFAPAGLELSASNQKVFSGIRVRMGIHTGKPNCRRNPVTGRMDYFGPVVNRAARVSDSAHGGQIVCTEEVKAALDKAQTDPDFHTVFPETVELIDLGLHSYKGVPDLVRVFQIDSPDLKGRKFPELRTEQSKGRKKSMAGHKLLDEEKDNYRKMQDSSLSLSDEQEEVYACGNPECINVETAETAFGACARCKLVKYCSVECQKKHWKMHKKVCKPE